eukprot:TRINITY_DN3335_c0_g1_i1.p1 TRINITY_DN3335_c0_g1~~TRINITY_DN3335_c0_g1_i1.p1  ORF type:complete len:1359 (+),score=382.24 TRINITY_DN3335_c0_g1_i1:43-4119(+)
MSGLDPPSKLTWKNASGFSKISFGWLSPLLDFGMKKPLEIEDLYDLIDDQQPEYLKNRYDELSLKKDTEMKHWSKMFNILKRPIIYSGVFKLFVDIFSYMAPWILNIFLTFIETTDRSNYMYGVSLAVGLLLCYALSSLFTQHWFWLCSLIGAGMRSLTISAVTSKMLSLSPIQLGTFSSGKLLNLINSDTERLGVFCIQMHRLWAIPVQMIMAIFLLSSMLDMWSAFAGIGVMILLIPVQMWFSTKIKFLRREANDQSDSRLKFVGELIGNIFSVKLNSWEEEYVEKIGDIRSKEVSKLRKLANVNAVNRFISNSTYFITTAACLSVFVIRGNELSVAKIFSSFSVFALLRFPLSFFPTLLSNYIDLKTSLARIDGFLDASLVTQKNLVEPEEEDAIVVQGLAEGFGYSESQNIGLNQGPNSSSKIDELIIDPAKTDFNKDKINELDSGFKLQLPNNSISIKKGEKVAIVGQIASGKSTLLLSLLGETTGIIEYGVKGSIAYVPQIPWITNSTFRENILFGLNHDADWYFDVLIRSELITDLELIHKTHGVTDLIEIGERGINLSGGMKQRVALARALYSKPDILILDDVFSALDAEVAHKIFHNLFTSGNYSEESIVVATHQVHLLKDFDRIIVLENGRLVDVGNFSELFTRCSVFNNLLKMGSNEFEEEQEQEQQQEQNEQNTTNESDETITIEFEENFENNCEVLLTKEKEPIDEEKNGRKRVASLLVKTGEKKLVNKEERRIGGITSSTLIFYFKQLGRVLMVILVIVFVLCGVVSVYQSYYLSDWVSQKQTNTDSMHSLRVYLLLGILVLITILVRELTLANMIINGAKRIHEILLKHIVYLPAKFFETQPTGRLLNRFSEDMNQMDTNILWQISSLFHTLTNVISMIFVIVYVLPWFVIVLIILAIVYIVVSKRFRYSAKEMKRIELISRSPLLQHFTESRQGLVTIKAFNRVDFILSRLYGLIENRNQANVTIFASYRWVGLRLEFLSALLVFFICVSTVFIYIPSSLVGLVISYSLTANQTLAWLVRMYSDCEMTLSSVERIEEYINEPAEKNPGKDNKPNNFARLGRVEFEQYSAGYDANAEPIIKDLSFKINPGEKIGIVGRTGSGKSTIINALFKMLHRFNGQIMIDNYDVDTVDIYHMRKSLTILPQSPFLFDGTLQQNLDPFNEYDEQKLVEVLKQVNFWNYVQELPGQLQFKVSEAGGNLSVGQKQLLCLARALLKDSKILILDEATASCDLDTDQLIQKTIRTHESFRDITILTIAHRLATIIDYDKILCLQNGYIVDFDSPKELLNYDSLFKSLVHQHESSEIRRLYHQLDMQVPSSISVSPSPSLTPMLSPGITVDLSSS